MCEACGPLALLSSRVQPTANSAPRRRYRPSAAPTRTERTNRFADLVLTGGPILAMDTAGSRPEAVAIRDGRFVAVGYVDEIATHVGPGTETIDAAWQCRADDIRGSIEVGKYADVARLEDDPTTVDPTTIASIAVSETRLAGQIGHQS